MSNTYKYQNKLNSLESEFETKNKQLDNRGIELDGKTVGIIGYGNMGKSFAKKLRGFDVEVICYDIKPYVGDENCKQVSLPELQEKVDVLSLHTPQNKLTTNMVNIGFINDFGYKSFFSDGYNLIETKKLNNYNKKV